MPAKALCSDLPGNSVSCQNGIVKNRKITGFHLREQFPELVVQPTEEQFGGIWSDDQPVVIDGNLISSRHPDDMPYFAGAIRDLRKTSPQRREAIKGV
jgi:putative intracellular protease/amidase